MPLVHNNAPQGMLQKQFNSGVPDAGTAVEACITPDNQYLMSGGVAGVVVVVVHLNLKP